MTTPPSHPGQPGHPGRPARPRRRVLPLLLVLAFVVVPLVEIYVIVQVGQVIGAWWTILLLVADSVLGGWLVRREGARTWTALRTALSTGQMPARELTDAALVLVAGTLMLTPGFVLDVVGLFLVLPLTRPIARRALTALVARRLLGAGVAGGLGGLGGLGGGLGGGSGRGPGGFGGADGPTAPPRPPGDARRPGAGPEGPVVRGEVVDEPPDA